MRGLLGKIGDMASRVETWWTLFMLVSGTGAFSWLGSQWDGLASAGWPAVTILAFLCACALIVTTSLGYHFIQQLRGRTSANALATADPPPICSLSIDTRLAKARKDYAANRTDFRARVEAHAKLSNVRIYARLYRLDSDYSDDSAFWVAVDEEEKIGEITVLRPNETFDIALGERSGETTSPLVVLGREFNRGNTYWPYLRVDLRAIADEGSVEESLAILSPGYVFNTAIKASMVPLNTKAFSLVELPSRQSLPDIAPKRWP